MKLFRNKIFIAIITTIFLLFSLQFYFISNSYKRDTNSYVMLLQGFGTLTSEWTKKVLKVNEKQQILNGDIINTLSNSLAVIEWWDKSITRLWENSKIMVKENFISDDLSKINISFELLKWQTWSNVLSIFSWESYFRQEVKGVSAAVRGTVFEMNYDKDYMIVHKHAVQLTNIQWENVEVYPGEAFSISRFSLEDLKNIIDTKFQQLNETMDQEYLKQLREEFMSAFYDTNPLNLVKKLSPENKLLTLLSEQTPKAEIEAFLSGLDGEKKQQILSYMDTLNQSLNFENGEDSTLYNIKLNLREWLISATSNQEYKDILVKYSLYDLADLLNLSHVSDEIFNRTVWLLSENTDSLKDKPDLLKAFWTNINIISDVLFMNWENINMDTIKNKLQQFDSKWQDVINNGLDKILDLFTK